jgi:acyl carrier protein
MNDHQARLARCFAAVFPQLPESLIPAATQATTEGWDSVATVTLFSLIQEEFGVSLDFDDLQNLESFSSIHDHLRRSA